jgi:hypothetical protein
MPMKAKLRLTLKKFSGVAKGSDTTERTRLKTTTESDTQRAWELRLWLTPGSPP